jgi:hypothetical protein
LALPVLARHVAALFGIFMSLSRSLWPWTLALAAIAGGCATIDADVELTPERPDRQAANEAASLDSELNADGAQEPDDSPVTVHVSDSGASGDEVVAAVGADAVAPQTSPAEYRSAKETAFASAQSRARLPAAAGTETHAVADEAAFDGLMREARDRGELTAADEAAFRRDLEAMPAHLRPQMAAMLLAMRKRSAEPAAPVAAAPSSAAALPKAAVSQLQSAALLTGDSQPTAFSAPTSTADRLTRIASGSAANPALDDNPLRALANATAKNGSGAPSSALLNAQFAAAMEQQAKRSPSNAPAEVVAPTARENLTTHWPDATSAAKLDRPPARPASVSATEEWQVMLGATIRSLEADLAKRPDDPENARREALLRMLYLVANRLDDAARPVPADAREQQFWVDWLYGTSVYLDSAATPNDGQRSAIAADRLRDAVQRLGEQSNLVVQNLAFCRKVTSFGVYESFDAKPAKVAGVKSLATVQEFAPNQEVLLYAEIRNFTSQSGAKGYHTALRPSYQIFDSAGRRLGSVVELDESHDYCQRPRTDFFVCYHIYLPTRIDPGSYTLKLTIEDVHGHKAGEDDIEFVIKGR